MKKILKKFCIICICLFCIICQVFDNSVYADSIEEIKKNVNFKTVEEDGEPDSYDVLIDAQDLITDEKLPAGIKTTIEDVLYDNSGIFSIDFFGNDKTNSKSSSKKSKKSKKNKNSSSNDTTQEDKTAEKAKAIRSFVRNTYKVFLYIACGAMITVLIYMAVVTVTSGISPSLNILPFSSIINGKKGEKNPNQYMKSKRLVEQWVISVISLALAVFVMNLIVAFSDNIVNAMENKKVENESITVYVKNSKFAVNAPILGGSGSSGSTTTSTTTTSSGDAATLRQKVVDQAKSLDNLGASGGYCEMWVELVYRTALNRPEIP